MDHSVKIMLWTSFTFILSGISLHFSGHFRYGVECHQPAIINMSSTTKIFFLRYTSVIQRNCVISGKQIQLKNLQQEKYLLMPLPSLAGQQF